MPYHYVDKFFPLTVMQPVGDLTNEEVQQRLDEDEALLLAHVEQNRRNVAIYDMTHLGSLTPVQREMQGDWLKENLDALQKTNVGTAFVVPDMIKRGLMTAIFWVQRYSLPYTIVATMPEAVAWCLETAREHGMELPESIREGGYHALEPFLVDPGEEAL